MPENGFNAAVVFEVVQRRKQEALARLQNLRPPAIEPCFSLEVDKSEVPRRIFEFQNRAERIEMCAMQS